MYFVDAAKAFVYFSHRWENKQILITAFSPWSVYWRQAAPKRRSMERREQLRAKEDERYMA